MFCKFPTYPLHLQIVGHHLENKTCYLSFFSTPSHVSSGVMWCLYFEHMRVRLLSMTPSTTAQSCEQQRPNTHLANMVDTFGALLSTQTKSDLCSDKLVALSSGYDQVAKSTWHRHPQVKWDVINSEKNFESIVALAKLCLMMWGYDTLFSWHVE